MNRVIASNEEFNEVDAAWARPMVGAAPQAGSRQLAEPERPCAGPGELDRLYAALVSVTAETHPRTAKLLGSGRRRAAQKVIEEAGEVALEAVKCRASGLVRESADLLYHLVVLWRRTHIDPADVYAEMQRRADALGIAEKLPKTPARIASNRRSIPRPPAGK
jgi:phosphoribosyl-ATP pyrophosphohydrolase